MTESETQVVVVCMKPLSKKTFVDQALKNSKGITWFDRCRIPFKSEKDLNKANTFQGGKAPQPMNWDKIVSNEHPANPQGRFPANLLVSDDVLNDGKVRKSGNLKKGHKRGTGINFGGGGTIKGNYGGDSGSYSRYFDLDACVDNLMSKKN